MSYFAKFRGQQAPLPPRLPARRVATAALGAALALGLVAALAKGTGQPLLLGSFGASAVFLFAFPEAPFAQPRNVAGGHVLCSLVGLACFKAFGPAPWALGFALGAAVALMLATRTVHAPAGSNPVIVFLTAPDWSFVVAPTLIGALGLVLIALLFNNAVLPGRYPLYWLGRAAAPEPARVPSFVRPNRNQ